MDHDDDDDDEKEKERILLKFKKAVIATGGRPSIPSLSSSSSSPIPGIDTAPYVTNEQLFNLQALPPRMVILGGGVIALEMAQAFATFGSKVTVLARSRILSNGDDEAANLMKKIMQEEDNITFYSKTDVLEVETLRQPTLGGGEGGEESLPLMKVSIKSTESEEAITEELECECLLIATGRLPNVQNLGLEKANVQYDERKGIHINDLAQSTSNPNVYAVGDCVANVPRLTHMSGEMAKVVVQNALFEDEWKVSSLVVPACMYTEPEYATVGRVKFSDEKDEVDVYTTSLEHNDRAILDGDSNHGVVKICCQKGTDTIVGCTIVAPRAGEMINEVSLAMKYGIGLGQIGRNIHCYPTTGEAIMMCGLQFINARWKRLD
uniref:FAD/NAD(P)-binding domain-containing protein n=1 Tax=Helicotheca tamesis TaxID=374047 RepID=A0A7S2IDD2_9STRA